MCSDAVNIVSRMNLKMWLKQPGKAFFISKSLK